MKCQKNTPFFGKSPLVILGGKWKELSASSASFSYIFIDIVLYFFLESRESSENEFNFSPTF